MKTTSRLVMTASTWVGCFLLPAVLHAEPAPQDKSSTPKPVGEATQAILGEQRNDINRADAAPFSAESAGRAYQKYLESYSAKSNAVGSDKTVSGASK